MPPATVPGTGVGLVIVSGRGATTVMVNVSVSVAPTESVTWTMNEKVPSVVGRPVTAPFVWPWKTGPDIPTGMRPARNDH